jgi:hypothetical protein
MRTNGHRNQRAAMAAFLASHMWRGGAQHLDRSAHSSNSMRHQTLRLGRKRERGFEASESP